MDDHDHSDVGASAAGAQLDEPHIRSHDLLDAAATELQAQHGCVCAWWQLTTFLEVSGEDAATFLDGISTQDMAGIDVGSARHALFLTSKARIIASVLAYRADDTRFLLELEPRSVETLAAHLARYRLRARVAVERCEAGAVTLVGPGAADAAAEMVATPDGAHLQWYSSPAWGAPAMTMVGSRADAHALVARLEEAGEPGLADPEALDAIRIDAGVPALNDLLVDSMPAEVGGVEHCVSLTKGCYLGQEPVARLHYRGHANRTLRRVELAEDLPDDYFDSRTNIDAPDDGYLAVELPEGGPDDRPVGMLTSWAHRSDGSITGLAVLRREVEPGQQLRMRGTSVILHAR